MAKKTEQKGKGAKGREPARKRRYSDEDKATALAALDANGGNVLKTARALKIPHKTLDEWAKGRNQVPEVADLRNEKKGELSARYEAVIHELVDVLADKRANASLKDVATAIGILTDKMQLLRGRPTAIIAQSAKDALAAVMRDYGLSQEEAVPMVAAEFGISEAELVSEANH